MEENKIQVDEINEINETNELNEENQEAKVNSTEEKMKLHKSIYIFYGITALAAIILIFANIFPSFADFFNKNISVIFRGFSASITNILPISFAELLVITLPISLVFIVRFALKKYAKDWHTVGIFCISILSLLGLFFSLYVFSFGVAYHTPTLDQKLDLEKKKVSKEELVATAEWLITEVNAEVDKIMYKEKSSSIMQYSIREMNLLLLDSYNSISEKYDFVPILTSYIKPIMLSEPMTYTHITGVYTFFTGEANLNTNSPDYALAFTAAHELAHQRGIAREDEANFMAFLVCTNSSDSYIRYCGYLNTLEYVLNALYSADYELWVSTFRKLDPKAIYEVYAYSEFYEKYRDNVVGEISGAVNDAYLQMNGTEGTVSYGLVVDLAVAYYNKNIAN